MRVLVAGGGTAGHIEPAMNLADELRRRDAKSHIVALGTERGLEVSLVPKRGYDIALVSAVPLPRKVNGELFRLPSRLRKAIKETRAVIEDNDIDVVVGFGGYVSIPAYFAARGRVPIVVHEANAKAGIANRIGARFASAIAECVTGSLPNAVLTGNPLRHSIATLNRSALRDQAREHFGISHDRTVVLVFGGSLGAQTLNRAVAQLLTDNVIGDVTIIHSYGAKNQPAGSPSENYVPVPFIDRMDLAYAAADFVICRSGAMTVAEISAVGLPACYVPLAHGNGEQALNVQSVVAAGGAIVIDDSRFDAAAIRQYVLPLLTNTEVLNHMSAQARTAGKPDAAKLLADLVESVVGGTK